jgi:hypothetical protein
MLGWLTHDGQASAASDGYVPLPSQVSSSPAPCSSRSPVPAEHTCWAEPRNDYDGYRCRLSLAC